MKIATIFQPRPIPTNYHRKLLTNSNSNLKQLEIMKRFLSFLCIGIFFINAYAQLTVDINGNVGIGDTLTNYDSQLSINGAGINTATVYSQTDSRLYSIFSENKSTNTDWTFAYYGKSFITAGIHVGLYGLATAGSALSRGRAIGVLGYATNATRGYNYGLFGGLGGTQNGAAVAGSINQPWGLSSPINGRYAGYFDGPVYSTSSLTALNYLVPSGSTNITDVRELEGERSYQGIMSIIPIEYKSAVKQSVDPEVMDTISSETMTQLNKIFSESEKSARPHFGLIAEDVQKIYPELVHEDANGTLCVDYIGLIPLLIKTIQQLGEEVKELRYAEEASKGFDSYNNNEFFIAPKQNVQLTNNGICEIEYTLPDKFKSAKVFIYSISGNLVKNYNLEESGDGKLSIDTRLMNKGIYIYTIIVDGHSICSRQLIVE